MSKGWISIHRQLWNHWLWEDKPFSKGQAWLDILLLVNHEDGKTLMDGKPLDVFRGEHITSEPKLAERWGWSRTKVRNFLEILEKEGMIKNLKEGRKRTRLTVCNYNDYQTSKDNRKTSEEQEKDKSETSEEQVKDINNNVNNENNMLLLSISKEFPNFYKWIEENNYTKEAEHPNDKPYYLKYLHEKANFYSKTKGKEHIDTINAIKAFENKKAIETEEVVLKAQSIG